MGSAQGTAAPAAPRWWHDRALLAIVALALGVRLVLSGFITVLHADEVWQYLEPAYGLITGNWVRAWEFHAGVRGWLVPLALVPPMALGHALAPQGQLHVWLVRALLSAGSLGVVVAWYRLAARHGRMAALLAAWVAAIWCEVFFFAVRPSAEAIGMALLFPALALADAPTPGTHPARRAFALGVLVALGFVVRFHYLPAIVLIVAWGLRESPRRDGPLLAAGILAGLALGGLADLATGHAPLLWIWRSIRFNVIEGGAAMFGTQPPWWFALRQIETWGWASLAIVPLALIGAWQRPVLLALAVAVYAPHSLIAHKEYRFVIFGTVLIVLLAVIGSAAIARRLGGARATGVALALGWAGLSLAVARTAVFVPYWTQGDDDFGTMVLAGEQPGLCGLAMVRAPAHPALAMTFFNRAVPALLFDGPEAPLEEAALEHRFNVAITRATEARALPRDFRLVTCWHQMDLPVDERGECVFVRSGGCSGDSGDFAYQPAMERRGK